MLQIFKYIKFKILLATLFILSSSLAISAPSDALSTVQTVKSNGSDNQKQSNSEKKAIAQAALEKYLNDLFFPNNLKEDIEIKKWIHKISKERFETLVLSWSTKPVKNETEVSLSLSLPILSSFIKNSPHKDLIDKISSSGKTTSIIEKGAHIPLSVFMFDESNRDIYVYPADNTSNLNSQYFKVHKIAFKPKQNFSDNEINSMALSLEERTLRYAESLRKKFPNQSLEYNTKWTESMFKAIDIAARALASDSKLTHQIPLSVTMLNNNLPSYDAVAFLFSARAADKTGVLEKVDILTFGGNRPFRTYWTRNLHDPLYKESPTQIFERAYSMHKKNINTPHIVIEQTSIKLILDRKVTDKDVVAIENLLKEFNHQPQFFLTPVEVTKDDYRYLTSISPNYMQKIISKINTNLPHLYARTLPSAEQNQLQIVLKTTKQ